MPDETGRRNVKFSSVPSKLSDENTTKRIGMAAEMLEVLKQDPKKWKTLITDDESCIHWRQSHDSQWLPERSARSSIPKSKIGYERSMVFVFFSLREFLRVKFCQRESHSILVS
jgi:hypothetical protein